MSLFGPTTKEYFNKINDKLDLIIMKQAEAVQKLEAAFSQLGKAKDEIMAELEKLRSSDPDLSPEGAAAVEKIGNIAQAIDDVIADQE